MYNIIIKQYIHYIPGCSLNTRCPLTRSDKSEADNPTESHQGI